MILVTKTSYLISSHPIRRNGWVCVCVMCVCYVCYVVVILSRLGSAVYVYVMVATPARGELDR